MQGTFVFVLLVIALGIFGRLANTYMKQRARRPENDTELQDTLTKIQELEDRVRVLERIVTESRVDLKQQIDGL